MVEAEKPFLGITLNDIIKEARQLPWVAREALSEGG